MKKYFGLVFVFSLFLITIFNVKNVSAVDSAWQGVGTAGFSAGSVDFTSLAVSSDGTPYVVYQDGGNSYKATVMKWSGTAWVAVGTAGFSAGQADYTSLAISSDGTPYVAYKDVGNSNKATVMKYNGTAWVAVGTVGFSIGGTTYTSLAISSDGTPYVAYRDGANNIKSTVMKYNGTAWVAVGTAGFSAGQADYTSLAISSDGTPYVAYRDSGNSGKATVMKYNGTAWELVGVAGFSVGKADHTSLTISSDGTPYVAYRDEGNSYKSTVMKYNGTAWVLVGTVGFSAGQADYTSLAISSDGTPYVGYRDGGNSNKATVMKYNGTAWELVGVAGFSAGDTTYTSLAISSDGTPYVTYSDVGNSYKSTVMKYAPQTAPSQVINLLTSSISTTQINLSWTTPNNGGSPITGYKIERESPVGAGFSTIVENTNNTNVSYQNTDLTPNTVYNYKVLAINAIGTGTASDAVVGMTSESTNNSWQNVGTAGFSAGVADFTSLAISSDGTPYVAYRDSGNSGKATVMKYNGTAWVAVGTAGFSAGVADYTSLAISSDGTPYVAYKDVGNSNKATVMKYNGTAWVLVGVVGFSAGQASYISLAISSDGTPYVVYQDAGNSNKATVMKYNGTAWVLVGVAGFSVGQASYISLAISSDGTPYVVYQDAGNSYKATVMKYNGTAWVLVGVVGFSAGQADYTSLAISSGGTPYVAYKDVGNSNKATVMKYNGTAWELVGTAGFSAGTASYTSLAISSDGTPYVAYRDSGNSGKATVMKYNGTAWVLVGTAGFSVSTVLSISLAISSDGTPYVTYSDVGNSYKATVMGFLPKFIPTLTTEVASTIFTTRATLNGTITLTGGESSTVRGFEYGLTESYGTTTTENGSFNIESFSTNVTNLICNKTYHYRSYATNSIGKGYGEDQTFTTRECTTVTPSLFSSIPDNINLTLNDGVFSSVVANNGTIYIGGNFNEINGTSRSCLASLNPDGTLTDFNPVLNGRVDSLALSHDQTVLYVGGNFTQINGGTRNRLASLNISDGTLTSFNPNIGGGGGGGRVAQLAISPNGSTLYAGGGFTTAGGVSRSHIASWDITNPNITSLTDFDAGEIDGGVPAMALSLDGSILYVGGAFSSINGETRNRLASVNTVDGSLTLFNPNLDGTVTSMTLSPNGSILYVSGWFATINDGEYTRNSFASFNTVDGTLTDFNPNINSAGNPGDHMIAISPDSSTLFLGGSYSQVGYELRNNLASWRISDGVFTDFDPNVDSNVLTLSFSPDGSKLYAGGSFNSVGGDETKQYFASFGLADFNSPTITLIGANTQNIYIGETYTDQGATATDNIDGNITNNIVVVNNVDTNTVGTYTITYNVDDAAGNHATELTRTVNVNKRPSGSTIRPKLITPVPTITPPPTTTPPNTNTTNNTNTTTTKPTFTKNILPNTRNNEVKQLQQLLKDLGYFTYTPTGYYGPITKLAVKKFQKDHNIKQTGTVGPQTRKALGGK